MQAIHAPVQALSQQTPWAQNPERHCVSVLQAAPLGLRPQEEFAQKLPATHCVSLEQVLKHWFPLHANGLQVREGEATH